ncbi:MAG: hypothetical protein WD342_05165 [Verrucomicrobiales bacterium]
MNASLEAGLPAMAAFAPFAPFALLRRSGKAGLRPGGVERAMLERRTECFRFTV